MEVNNPFEDTEKRMMRQRLAKHEQENDLLAVLELPEGRRFLARLMREAGMGGFMAVNAGMVAIRNFALGIHNEVQALHPEAAMEILKLTFENGAQHG